MSPSQPKSATKSSSNGTASAEGKKPGRLQKLNARALRLQTACESVAAELSGYVAALPEEERKGKTGQALVGASTEANRLASTSSEIPKHLFRLHELKWEPAKKPAAGVKAGDVVALRDRRVERFTKNGAYTEAQIAKLEVVSVHADQAKVRIAGSKELLGLVPTSWLTAKNAGAQAAA